MRIAVRQFKPRARHAPGLPRPDPAAPPEPEFECKSNGFFHHPAHGEPGIERRRGILKHHLHLLAHRPQALADHRARKSTPDNRMAPRVGSMTRRMQRPSVDFPQPQLADQPERLAGAEIVRLTPSTARAIRPTPPNRFSGKCSARSSTSSSAGMRVSHGEAGGGVVACADRHQRRAALSARRRNQIAPVGIPAARRRPQQGRHRARDRRQGNVRVEDPAGSPPPALACTDAPDDGTARVPVLLRRCCLGVHHGDPVAGFRDHAEVMGDQNDCGPQLCCSRRIRSRICAWIVTSSAVVGSSAISSFGWHASAIAITAR